MVKMGGVKGMYLRVQSNGFASKLIEWLLADDVSRDNDDGSKETFPFIDILHHRLEPHWLPDLNTDWA